MLFIHLEHVWSRTNDAQTSLEDVEVLLKDAQAKIETAPNCPPLGARSIAKGGDRYFMFLRHCGRVSPGDLFALTGTRRNGSYDDCDPR